MSKKALVATTFGRDTEAQLISQTWFNYNSQRREMIEQWKELRNYIFATDTSTTSNKTLPWKNSTTLPKLCQIRDNLHSNYMSALFPNDDWMKWEAYSLEDAAKNKTRAIEAYMGNKTREGLFRSEISKLIYDYIDYGNAFCTPYFENSFRTDDNDNRITDFIGPRVERISPLDIIFNPISSSFRDSFKIIRRVKNVGELHMMAQDNPDDSYLNEALMKRNKLMAHANAYGIEESDKAEGFQVDGFGNYYEYLQSGFCEFLHFYGDFYNKETNELQRGRHIVIVDRMFMIINEPIRSWFGSAPIYHVGWRTRPDNLWAMGPLDNLIGMQYRIDHLENIKADAMDLAVIPPLVIAGEVEEFDWSPGAEIHIDENGTVTELGKNVQWVLAAESNIDKLEHRMEMFAGAPREAMGIRSAGEKTAFEVDQLMTAAGRIFQEKVTLFETELLEPLLNGMLETAKRNMERGDVVRVIDDDLGVSDFLSVTKEDITASGVIRPIGARHYAAQRNLVQNLTALSNTTIWQQIAPHIKSKQLANLVEDVLGLHRYSLFAPNASVFEQQEYARLANQVQEDLEVEQVM